MELKQYQQEVINDLSSFIDFLEKTEQLNQAFTRFWDSKGISFANLEDDFLKPYDNSIKGVPRVTVKVPTAGGKTFIACNALKPIFDSFPAEKPKVVAWFVPSDTILKQTYRNLNNPEHPYRQKIDALFGNTVRVLEKESLLYGQGFNPVEVKEQISILVLSVQSFASKNKEGRKVYRENENLAEFPKTFAFPEKMIEGADETALIQVIAQLNPVVIIDESHNFEANLRVEMLNSLNPAFILDLTATPKEKSNIISFVDAMKLKQNNMVKLPVIVYNHHSTDEVIISAINLQKTLEEKAKINEEAGGKYIRPIVLFQAQPKTDEDNITFEKIKTQLIEIGIPEKQIRIKTANKDEIKNEDLMSPECQVRFIITVNALKEGWDCPFAYILATLANKSSTVDVEQILGRILRLPYTAKHSQELLNYSYVFTSSNEFQKTLDKILIGLNKAGFSRKDYRVKETQIAETVQTPEIPSLEELFAQAQQQEPATSVQTTQEQNDEIEINVAKLKELSSAPESQDKINDIIQIAQVTNEEYEKKLEEFAKEETTIPSELMDKVKSYPIKDIFKSDAENIQLPVFYRKIKQGSLLEPEGKNIILSRKMLLDGFDLSTQDSNIDFTTSAFDMATVDLTGVREDEYVPEYRKANTVLKQAFVEYITKLPEKEKINQLAHRLAGYTNKQDEFLQPQIVAFITKAIESLSSDKIQEILHNEYYFSDLVKRKINSLADNYAEKQFNKLLDTGEISCIDTMSFPARISPKNTMQGITKNLYVEEGEMNDFEKSVINDIANLDTVQFWHRNLERGKGFMLNGFINHYPDFIVKMKNGRIILIETKGDDRDNSDSKNKLKLGEKWASKAGDKYRYFMVFNTARLEGAKSRTELIDILKSMS